MPFSPDYKTTMWHHQSIEYYEPEYNSGLNNQGMTENLLNHETIHSNQVNSTTEECLRSLDATILERLRIILRQCFAGSAS